MAIASGSVKMESQNLSAFYGDNRAIQDVNLQFPDRKVTAIIGPSGCGKSTLIRCLNRLHETAPRAHVEGSVLLDGEDLYHLDATAVRRRVGMVFQKPNPFATMSIYNNVSAPLRFNSRPSREETDATVLRSLKQAALWDEVKDRVDEAATSLSGGQQQRLCIARALAVRPRVLLLDEPTSALDPAATQRVETTMQRLKEDIVLILVTHNVGQAARVSDRVAFLHTGKLVEVGPTGEILERPREALTEQFITGRFT